MNTSRKLRALLLIGMIALGLIALGDWLSIPGLTVWPRV